MPTSVTLRVAALLWASVSAAQETGPILTTLYSFQGGTDGQSPIGAVVGSSGILYGVTGYGGGSPCHFGHYTGCGTIFSLAPPASPGVAWTETVLHTFTAPGDGVIPSGRLLRDGELFYGTTTGGGSSNNGTVFQLAPPSSPGGAWVETVLYSFAGGADGQEPAGGVAVASGPGGLPVFYGTTRFGGTSSACSGGCGAVFSLTPPASPGGP